jgi:hypothetical protein
MMKQVASKYPGTDSRTTTMLSGIDLPEATELYLTRKVANYYYATGHGDGTFHATPWLYLPDTIISQFISSWKTDQDINLGEPLKVHNTNLYPIVIDQEAIAILVSRDQLRDRTVLRSLREKLSMTSSCSESSAQKLFPQFVNKLFQHDMTLKQFLNRALNFICNRWSDCYGAVFVRTGSSYKLNLASGNIIFCHMVPRELSLKAVAEFRKREVNHSYLIPVDIDLNEPQFYESPPNLTFFCRGVHSRNRRQLFVLTGPGTLDKTVADNEAFDAYSLGEFLVRIYHDVANDLFICRLCLTPLDRKPGFRVSTIVTDLGEQAGELIKVKGLTYEVDIIDDLTHGKIRIVKQACDLPVDGTSAGALNPPAMQSELLLPITVQGCCKAILGVGLTLPPARVDTIIPPLEALSDLIGLYWRLEEGISEGISDSGAASKSAARFRAIPRLESLRKLTQGLQSHILGQLSTIVGQSDLSRCELESLPPVDALERMKGGLMRIAGAADGLLKSTELLKCVSTLSHLGTDVRMPAAAWLESVPVVMNAYSELLSTHRGIRIVLETLPPPPDITDLPGILVFDYLVPILIGIVEQAENSGTVELAIESDSEEAIARFEVPNHVISSYVLESIIDSVTPNVIRSRTTKDSDSPVQSICVKTDTTGEAQSVEFTWVPLPAELGESVTIESCHESTSD